MTLLTTLVNDPAPGPDLLDTAPITPPTIGTKLIASLQHNNLLDLLRGTSVDEIDVDALEAQTFDRALISDGAGHMAVSPTTAAELAFISGLSSALQTQLDNKVSKSSANTYSGGGTQNFGTANLINLTNLLMLGHQDVQRITPPAPAPTGMRLYAEDTNNFSNYKMIDQSGLILSFLEDQSLFVRNTSGTPMVKGQVVHITGATGNIVNVNLAKAVPGTPLEGVAVLSANLADNAFCRAFLIGNISGVDTSGMTEGDTLFVSDSVAGAFTNIEPPHPNDHQALGHVTTVGGNGSIHINVLDLHGEDQGTNKNTFKIGNGLVGNKKLEFVNDFVGSLEANPTANRTWALPNESGTVALNMISVIKQVDETINNDAAFHDDAELKFTPQINKTYKIQLTAYIQSTSDPNFKHVFSVPTGATGKKQTGALTSSLTATLDIDVISQFVTNGTIEVTVLQCSLVMGATSGDFIYRWAQLTSGVSDTTVFKGSSLVVWEET